MLQEFDRAALSLKEETEKKMQILMQELESG
jgi:hypothetical protein